MISVWPLSSLSLASTLSRGVREPTRRSERIPHRINQSSCPEKCWRANISVGAMIATCIPVHSGFFCRLTSIAWTLARSATTVFPVPTSHWSIRAIAWGRSISLSIWKSTIRCLFVSGNGSETISDFMISVSSVSSGASPRESLSSAYFFSRPRFWKWYNSSYPSSDRDLSKSSSEVGKCIYITFSRRVRNPCFVRISTGTVSIKVSARYDLTSQIFSRIQIPGI